MNKYHFKNKVLKSKGKVMVVENVHKDSIGYIKKTDLIDCERGSVFSYTVHNGGTFVMGIKKRGFKNILTPTYLIQTNEKSYTLKDKAWNNLLYFCVTGRMNGYGISIEETWSGDLEVTLDQEQIAIIQTNNLRMNTILIKKDISETSIFFATIILMYFMYKIYKDEADFVEDLLFEI